MNDKPLVSVVTAAYNMGQYLEEAIVSVLSQDHPRIQLIVVDDGSTDPDTPAVLARYEGDPRVTVVRQANAGQTVAKNRGLAEACGEFVGFCDADNAWLPGKLSRQLAAFRERPELGVVYGDLQLIGPAGESLPTPPCHRYSGRITGKLLADNFVTFNTTLVPRPIIENLGGFDERLRMAIDYELWLRVSLTHEFLYLPEPMVRYRIWGGQMSHRAEERLASYFRLLENFLAAHPDQVTRGEVRRAWAHSLTTRGRYRASVGRRAEALDDYRRALGHRPWDLRTLKSIGRLALRRR
jgi:glycosyltransferase involved in cell wall biosynthesis